MEVLLLDDPVQQPAKPDEELSEEKLEWRAIKRVFKKYAENEKLLKQKQRSEFGQLGIDFALPSPAIVLAADLERQDAKSYNKAVMTALRGLTAIEQRVITLSYLNVPVLQSWQIYEQLHLGRTLYFTTKSRAIGKLYVLFRAAGLQL